MKCQKLVRDKNVSAVFWSLKALVPWPPLITQNLIEWKKNTEPYIVVKLLFTTTTTTINSFFYMQTVFLTVRLQEFFSEKLLQTWSRSVAENLAHAWYHDVVFIECSHAYLITSSERHIREPFFKELFQLPDQKKYGNKHQKIFRAQGSTGYG